MEHSEQLNELATALAKAQANIKDAEKDRTNPYFKSKYATLSSIWDACRDELTKHGLSIVQAPCSSAAEGYFGLSTMLLHSSGQWVKETAFVRLAKDDPQGAGSACTYLRRYALAAFASVCPDDDDGNAGSQQSSDRQQARQQPHAESKPVPWDQRCAAKMDQLFGPTTKEQAKQIAGIITGKPVTSFQGWTENHWRGFLDRMEKLSPEQAQDVAIAAGTVVDATDPFADPNEGATPPAQSLGI